MKIIAHGDIDGVMSAALVCMHFNDVIPVEYHRASDRFDATGAIVVDMALNRFDPAGTTGQLARCRAWIDHHDGWTIEDHRLHVDVVDCCARVVKEYYGVQGGDNLVDIAAQCDHGYPKTREAIIYHKTLKTDMVHRSVKDLILLGALGLAPPAIFAPYVERYDRDMNPVTMALHDARQKADGLSFTNATTIGQPYDKSKLLHLLSSESPLGAVVSSREGGRMYTTVATLDENVNLVELAGIQSGSPGRVTLKGNRLVEVMQWTGRL